MNLVLLRLPNNITMFKMGNTVLRITVTAINVLVGNWISEISRSSTLFTPALVYGAMYFMGLCVLGAK